MSNHKDFNYEQAEKALMKLLKEIAVIKLNRKNSFDYKGPDIESSSILATSPNIKETFNKESLYYHKERGRNKIKVFINKVFQLGYSVGYEKCLEQYQYVIDFVDGYLKKNKT